ncbi:hypothetical protein [Sphingomonas sp.]|uniref:hypothetical protein n=1 Tax=Sphingomonas sp. TaxID=28214 RepID=UPI003AFF6EAE
MNARAAASMICWRTFSTFRSVFSSDLVDRRGDVFGIREPHVDALRPAPSKDMSAYATVRDHLKRGGGVGRGPRVNAFRDEGRDDEA